MRAGDRRPRGRSRIVTCSSVFAIGAMLLLLVGVSAVHHVASVDFVIVDVAQAGKLRALHKLVGVDFVEEYLREKLKMEIKTE